MNGLAEPEAARRLRRHGPNRLRERRPEPLWEELLEELAEPMILLLLGAGALYALWGEAGDAVTILVVVVALVAVEGVGEPRGEVGRGPGCPVPPPPSGPPRDRPRRAVLGG